MGHDKEAFGRSRDVQVFPVDLGRIFKLDANRLDRGDHVHRRILMAACHSVDGGRVLDQPADFHGGFLDVEARVPHLDLRHLRHERVLCRNEVFDAAFGDEAAKLLHDVVWERGSHGWREVWRHLGDHGIQELAIHGREMVLLNLALLPLAARAAA